MSVIDGGGTRADSAALSDGVPKRADAAALRIRLMAALVAADGLAIISAFLITPYLRAVGSGWYALPVVVSGIYVGTAVNAGAYRVEALRNPAFGLSAALRSLLFTYGAMFLISYYLRVEQRLPRLLLFATMLLAAALLVTARRIIASLVERYWRRSLSVEMLLDAGSPVTDPPSDVIRVSATGAKLVPDLRNPVMMNRFAALVRGADRVVIASPAADRRNWAMMLKGTNVVGEVLVDDIANVGAFGLGSLGRHSTLVVSAGPLSGSQRIVKRCFDLALCAPILLLLAPVLFIIAAAIKLDSQGPVFFRQRRVGRDNAFFEILKFRSMRVEQSDPDGHLSTRRDDDRITRVGRLIRRTSVDELPQLLNVLGGSMSLVGPRPHALGSLAGEHLFWDVDERYWHRHALKPGITGLAQIRGFRGATHHPDDLANRLQADLEYAANWSVWVDIMILLSTFKVIVHKNTY